VLKTDLWEESCGDDNILRSFASRVIALFFYVAWQKERNEISNRVVFDFQMYCGLRSQKAFIA
jgi:hypothetical protein